MTSGSSRAALPPGRTLGGGRREHGSRVRLAPPVPARTPARVSARTVVLCPVLGLLESSSFGMGRIQTSRKHAARGARAIGCPTRWGAPHERGVRAERNPVPTGSEP